MIQDISSFGQGGNSRSNMRYSEPVRATAQVVANPHPESVEAEISRLTWKVIDGKATPEERSLLSELIGLQHGLRAS